jgi:hypothetical protein
VLGRTFRRLTASPRHTRHGPRTRRRTGPASAPPRACPCSRDLVLWFQPPHGQNTPHHVLLHPRARDRRAKSGAVRTRNSRAWQYARELARARNGRCVDRDKGGCSGQLGVHHMCRSKKAGRTTFRTSEPTADITSSRSGFFDVRTVTPVTTTARDTQQTGEPRPAKKKSCRHCGETKKCNMGARRLVPGAMRGQGRDHMSVLPTGW